MKRQEVQHAISMIRKLLPQSTVKIFTREVGRSRSGLTRYLVAYGVVGGNIRNMTGFIGNAIRQRRKMYRGETALVFEGVNYSAPQELAQDLALALGGHVDYEEL